MTKMNEDLLTIVKALAEKIENLERTIYAKDSLLMKAGLVVVDSPTPRMASGVEASGVADVSSMEWSDIHKMVKTMGVE